MVRRYSQRRGQMIYQPHMKAKDKLTCYHLVHWYSLKEEYVIDVTHAGSVGTLMKQYNSVISRTTPPRGLNK